MIILIGSHKGGPGKSTVTINLAVAAAREGRSVLLVDADREIGTTSRWHADRQEAGITPELTCVQLHGRIHKNLEDLAQHYDLVLVDVAGKDSPEMRSALGVADRLIVVVQPSNADLDVLPFMADLVDKARDFNPQIEARVLINRAGTNRRVNEVAESIDYIESIGGLDPVQAVLHDRKIYRDVLGEGKGVLESSNSLARRDIKAVAQEVLS